MMVPITLEAVSPRRRTSIRTTKRRTFESEIR